MINEKLKDAIDALIDSPWMMFQFHEGAGTVVSDRAGRASDATVLGTTAGIWANPTSGITCAGTNNFNVAAAEVADIFDVRDYEGHLLIAFDLYLSANPTDREYVCAYGDNQDKATDGYLAIEINNTGPSIYLVYQEPGGAYQTVSALGALTTGVRIPLMIDIGFSADAITYAWYRSGVIDRTGTLNPDGTARPGVSTKGLRMLSQTFGSAANRPLGLYGSGARLENFLAMRIGNDDASKIARIAKDMANAKGDLSQSMAGI